MRLKAMFLHPGSIIQSIGLNIVRALSLISLLWVLLSAIIDMNTNVKAVNAFEKNRGDFTLVDCEYIELSDFLSYHFFYSLFFFLEEVQYLTNSAVSFGPLCPVF